MTSVPKVLILGAGFAGLGAARKLAKAPVDVVLVDRHDYHTFQPLLYQVATDILDPETVGHPVREYVDNQPNLRFVTAKVSGIDVRNRLDSAWRYLFLSEVTDASGINPYRGETEYGLSHATEALRIARSVINEAKAAMKATAVTIDPGAETMTSGASDDPLVGEPTSAPFELGVTAGDRSADVSWEQIAAGHHRVSVHFGEGLTNEVSVSFPGELTDEFVVTRALADTAPVSYKRSDFTFDAFYLALPIGLISLGPNLFLIKDMSRVHLAAKITRDSGDIAFADQTLADHDTPTWVFHVFEGSPQEAVDLARRINAVRKVTR